MCVYVPLSARAPRCGASIPSHPSQMSATLPSPQRPRVSALRLYPIKGLCPVNVPSVVVRPGGKGLQYDRQWALLNPEGRYVNGKSCPALHRIRLTAFTPPSTVRMQREVRRRGGRPCSSFVV